MKNPPSLSSRRDFGRVLGEGTRIRARAATFYMLSTEADRPARLGLAVPARVGSAVARNRIKRRMRAAFRALGASPGLDVVVRANPEAGSVSFQKLEEDLRRAVGAT